MRWVKCKNCVVSDMRWRFECWLNCENVKSTSSRLSWLFEGWPSFYIERIVFLMETIVFNSIQVINYWFILHRALRPLYQQAQTFSPNIWGISDQNVTHTTYKIVAVETLLLFNNSAETSVLNNRSIMISLRRSLVISNM